MSNSTYNMRGGEFLTVYSPNSPNYPNDYNNPENILWHVRAFQGRRFIITFGIVRLYSIRDYVRIYTGISDVFEESTQIFRLTYNSTDDFPDQYWSVHPNMWLQFSTDAFGTDLSFFFAVIGSGSYGGEKQGLCLFHINKLHQFCHGLLLHTSSFATFLASLPYKTLNM